MRLLLLFLFTFSLFAQTPLKPKVVTVWNYYLFAPFVTGENSGLAYDFVKLLNTHAQGVFDFRLENLPRIRLNNELSKYEGIVLFVNPKWMGKNASERYFWSKRIFIDRNEVLSSSSNKIEFHGVESLKGKYFGAIRGRKYQGIDPLLESEEIIPVYVNSEKQALRMLASKRIDVTTQPRSMSKALIKEMGLGDKIYFSQEPLFSYSRHVLVTKELKEVYLFLLGFMANLDENKQWQAQLKYHGLRFE